jgi:regulator of sirC expression with transglutaminase-like and TPR domain
MAGSPSPLSLRAPTPLEYWRSLVADDAGLPMVEAAASIAMDEHPDLDPGSVVEAVDAMGARLKSRLPADAAPLQRLRALNRFFFQEQQFAGNVNDYHDRRNSYLHSVLEMRRGIPISLAVLYVELARETGLRAHGVSFPGHFLARVGMPQGDVVIDPFNGQSMSRESLDAMLQPYRKRRGLAGAAAMPLALFLQPASPRDTLARMLRNLKELHRASGDEKLLLAVQERMVTLLPEAWEERRDRGLVHAALGDSEAAAADLAAYLEHADRDAPDRADVVERLLALGRGRPHRLH